MEYYFTCCATFFSALLGLVFSFHTVRTSKGTAKANALYLLTRSIALVLISATPVLLQSLDVLIAITCAMLIVQTIDGAIGIYEKSFQNNRPICDGISSCRMFIMAVPVIFTYFPYSAPLCARFLRGHPRARQRGTHPLQPRRKTGGLKIHLS